MNASAIGSLCRLCLHNSNSYADIFANDGSQVLQISCIINEVLDLSVSENDGFPVYICRVCLDKVVNIKLFKNQCQASTVKLHWAITRGSGELVREELDTSRDATNGLLDAENTSWIQIKEESISYNDGDPFSENMQQCHQEETEEIPETSSEELSTGILRIPNITDAFNTSGSKGMVIQDLQKAKTVADGVESLKLPPRTYSKFCSYCQKKFSRQDKLRYHIIQKHTKDKKHICQKCGKRFAAQFMLTRHMRVHTKQFPCEFCQLSFKSEDFLRNHMSINHLSLEMPSSEDVSRGCLKDVSNRLQEPSSPLDDQSLQLTSLLTTSNDCSLQERQLVMSKDALLLRKEPLNGWNLRLRRSVKRMNVGGSDVERVSSVVGDSTGGKRDGADRGIKTLDVMGRENVRGASSDGTLSPKGNIGSVVEVVGVVVPACTNVTIPVAPPTPNDPLWNEIQSDFMCSLCQRGFMDKAAVEKHMAMDHGKIKYAHVCKVCGYGTNKMSRLNAHLKVHLPEKPYQCSVLQ